MMYNTTLGLIVVYLHESDYVAADQCFKDSFRYLLKHFNLWQVWQDCQSNFGLVKPLHEKKAELIEVESSLQQKTKNVKQSVIMTVWCNQSCNKKDILINGWVKFINIKLVYYFLFSVYQDLGIQTKLMLQRNC